MAGSLPAMHQQQQQQHQQDQQQHQKQKQHTEPKKQRWYSNDKDDQITEHPHVQPKEENDIVASLKSEIAAIVENVTAQNGSVDNHIKNNIKNNQKKKRIELCPVCRLAECPLSKEIYE